MKQQSSNLSRRKFLARTSAWVATASIVPGSVLGLRGATSANSRLNIACIGVGGRGGDDLNEVSTENIVALCDVDSRRAAANFKKFPQARQFRDFRQMFDVLGKEIDAVVVGTPDHTHAVAAMRAIKMGKHVYCEKPLAHSIFEVRALMAAAREHKVVTQLGNQGHSFASIRAFVEWIQAGVIGPVREVHAACGSIYGRPELVDEINEVYPVPEGLDWDLWLGPVPPRNYNPMYVPGRWRGWSAFGTGVIGDWVCHVVDPVFWALALDAPTHIEALETDNYDPAKDAETFPTGSRIRFDFPAHGSRPAIKLFWYEGTQKPPRPPELEPGRNLPGTGAVVVGDTGKIVYGSHGAGGLQIIPRSRGEGYSQQPKHLPLSPGQHREWINACKGGSPTLSNFAYGGRLTELALLGIIAIRCKGKRLAWDGAKMSFSNCPEANAYLKPTFREGWSL